MVERIDGLSQGVLGFRLRGKLSRDEYTKQLMQPIYDALERGDRLRSLIDLPDDFEGLDVGALWEDLKAAGSMGLKHRSAWGAIRRRKDWVRHGVSVFGWMSPGELRVFEPGELDRAAAWVAEDSSA